MNIKDALRDVFNIRERPIQFLAPPVNFVKKDNFHVDAEIRGNQIWLSFRVYY